MVLFTKEIFPTPVLITQFSPTSCHFIPRRSSTPCSRTPSVGVPPLMSETKYLS
jgi:hypothetical protein